MTKSRFEISCVMEDRWIPYFLSMLNKMEELGNIGSSKVVGLYSDGDGDFKPSFLINGFPIHENDLRQKGINTPVVEPRKLDIVSSDIFYDAG